MAEINFKFMMAIKKIEQLKKIVKLKNYSPPRHREHREENLGTDLKYT